MKEPTLFVFALFVFMMIMIYANGGTFGQRCSAYSGSEFETCLTRLSNGGQP